MWTVPCPCGSGNPLKKFQ
ncbi:MULTISPECIES: SEC-C metal-binding domain-containing protein [Micrococcaceae]|uniref:Uncharacterized protein n=1 Tax=Arthrobacter oryzae TaxID=409290 RepID=A0A3N0BS45_9MICC|nr:hypothetical protein NIBR502770_00400 [Pseudarthrobacter sp. NIBRBAC000502770]RNL51851.1 hypothetical protein D7003_14890 [Arthrobacter oryzae]